MRTLMKASIDHYPAGPSQYVETRANPRRQLRYPYSSAMQIGRTKVFPVVSLIALVAVVNSASAALADAVDAMDIAPVIMKTPPGSTAHPLGVSSIVNDKTWANHIDAMFVEPCGPSYSNDAQRRDAATEFKAYMMLHLSGMIAGVNVIPNQPCDGFYIEPYLGKRKLTPVYGLADGAYVGFMQ